MAQTYIQLAAGLIAFQAFLFGVFLCFHGQGNQRAHKMLALFLFVVAFEYADTLVVSLGWVRQYPHIGFIGNTFGILFGTAIWFYVVATTCPNFRFEPRHGVHLVPFALLVAYSLFFYHLRDESGMRRIMAGEDFAIVNTFVLPLLGHSLIFLYLLAALRLLLRQSSRMASFSSNLAPYQLHWLRVVLGGFIIFWILRILQIPLLFVVGRGVWVEALYNIQTGAMFLFINVLIFKTMGQHPVFQDVLWDEGASADFAPPIAKLPLPARDRQADLAGVEAYMLESRPYLDPNLTVIQLAGQLEMSPKYLSQILNEVAGRNFFEFVNGYRIDEAAAMLQGERKVLDIAAEVGFNSKSAFNRAFKKRFDLTPTQYKKRLSERS